MNQFCTITTSDHFYKVRALRDSLLKFDNHILLNVLVVDSTLIEADTNICLYYLHDLLDDAVVKQIVSKYKNKTDRLRWSLKPSFLKYLLRISGIDKVIYLDNDLFFFNDFSFLFNYLETNSFLLTPHYYDRSPYHDQNWLEANFRAGLFNAGFIGVNKNAVNSLQWWAECCLYRCKKSAFRGTFDDQKYLDLIPVMQEDAMILRHQGLNVAEWNRFLCVREMVNGEVLINNTWPIVFIHFNNTTIREIMDGNEPLLVPFWNSYFNVLQQYNSSLQQNDLYKPKRKIDLLKYSIWKFLTTRGI